MAAELGRVVYLRGIRIAHFRRGGSDPTYREGEAAREAVGGWEGMRSRFYSPEMIHRRDLQIAALRERMTGPALPTPEPVPPWLTESLVLTEAAR
jgi:hypothetical protein